MTTKDMQPTTQNLEAVGANPRLAAILAESLAVVRPLTGRGPSSISILAAATGFGFAPLTAAMGWILIEVHASRERLTGEIHANRERVDYVETRLSGEIQSLSGMVQSLSSEVQGVSQRMTRIETLLEERLPARR